MKKNLELSKEEVFKIDKQKKLGVMRIDWYDGALANKWNPTNLLTKLRNENNIDLKCLQRELNDIQFDKLKNFEKVGVLCGGTGYDNETLIYVEGKYNNYVIKLIPVIDSYSYIFTYTK